MITGASRGIGKSISEQFAREGAMLVLSARTRSTLDAIAEKLRETGVEVLVQPADVSIERDVVALIAAAARNYGKIDILVNNAGIGIFKPVSETGTDEFDALFDVNMRGVFIATREVLRHMVEQNDGTIINIASLAGKNPVENGAVYAATKWALLGFSKSIMLEMRKHNIRVVAIYPGSVDTEFGSGHHPDGEKILQADDVAEAAVLAASLPPRAMMSEIDLRPTNPK